MARPGRSLLTALGTVVGLAAVVIALGLSDSAQSQVSSRFASLDSGEVTVAGSGPVGSPDGLPEAAVSRSAELGIRAAGLLWQIRLGGDGVARASLTGGQGRQTGLQALAVSPGVLDVAGARGIAGSLLRVGPLTAVVGVQAARELNLHYVGLEPIIYVGGIPFTVTGEIESVQREPELLNAVLIDVVPAARLWGPPTSSAQLLLQARPAAAARVAELAPTALLPTNPSALSVVSGTTQFPIAAQINRQLTRLVLLVGLILLTVGALSISAATVASVVERVYEIGLRRAVGARRRDIAAQFVLESLIIGGMGGALAGCVAVLGFVIVHLTTGSAITVEPWTVIGDPFVGAAIGMVAGLYPAGRAARQQPIDALRH